MSEPVKLVTHSVDEEARQQAIQFLEEALADARAGKIVSAVLIYERPDGWWAYDLTPVRNFTKAIGQLEVIKTDWIELYRKDVLTAV